VETTFLNELKQQIEMYQSQLDQAVKPAEIDAAIYGLQLAEQKLKNYLREVRHDKGIARKEVRYVAGMGILPCDGYGDARHSGQPQEI